MNKDNSILYNILYQDGNASKLFPELKYSGNAVPRRFSKQGETIELFMNKTTDKITAYCGSPYVTVTVNDGCISITFQPNTTPATRQARIGIDRTDASGTYKLLHFVVHQK